MCDDYNAWDEDVMRVKRYEFKDLILFIDTTIHHAKMTKYWLQAKESDQKDLDEARVFVRNAGEQILRKFSHLTKKQVFGDSPGIYTVADCNQIVAILEMVRDEIKRDVDEKSSIMNQAMCNEC